MEFENILTEIVKEKGITKMILDYKFEMEMIDDFELMNDTDYLFWDFVEVGEILAKPGETSKEDFIELTHIYLKSFNAISKINENYFEWTKYRDGLYEFDSTYKLKSYFVEKYDTECNYIKNILVKHYKNVNRIELIKTVLQSFSF